MMFRESPVYVWSLTTFSVPKSIPALYFYFSLAFRYRVRDTRDFPTVIKTSAFKLQTLRRRVYFICWHI